MKEINKGFRGFSNNEIEAVNHQMMLVKRTLPYRLFFIELSWYDFTSHKEIEIIYVVKGQLEVKTRFHDLVLKPGDLFVIASCIAHSVRGIGDGTLLMVMQIQDEYLEEFQTRQQSTKQTLVTGLVVDNDLHRDFLSGMRALYSFELSKETNMGSHLEIFGVISTCLSRFSASPQPKSYPRPISSTENTIIEIVEYYADCFDEDIKLGDLSLKWNTSESHLSRTFKSITGVTLSSYFGTKRLNRAMDLLLNTNYPISHISDLCGFSDAKAFYRSFKKKFCCTPSGFRKDFKQRPVFDNNLRGIENSDIQLFMSHTDDGNTICRAPHQLSHTFNFNGPTRKSSSLFKSTVDFNMIIDNEISNLSNLEIIFSRFDFKEVRFNVTLVHDTFMLQSRGGHLRELSNHEMHALITAFRAYNITPVLRVDFLSFDKAGDVINRDNDLICRYERLRRALDFGGTIIDPTTFSQWKFELYIPQLELVFENNRERIFSHIEAFHRVLKDKFDNNFIWGIYIGEFSLLDHAENKRKFQRFQSIQSVPDFFAYDLLYTRHNTDDTLFISYLSEGVEHVRSEMFSILGEQASAIICFKYVANQKFIPDDRFGTPYYNLVFLTAMLQFQIPQLKLASWSLRNISNPGLSPVEYGNFYNKFGIPRSEHYIAMFMNKLKEDVLAVGPGFYASKEGMDVSVLLYADYNNYKDLRSQAEINDEGEILTEVSIRALGLRGRYKTTEYYINYRSLQYYKKWVNQSGVNNLTEEEINFMWSKSIPEMKVRYHTIDDTFDYQVKLSHLGVKLIQYHFLGNI